MKSITIEGQLRTESGKKATRQLRSQKLVPGVIYGGNKEINFSAPASAFKSIVYTSEFMLADISVEGSSYKCILKDIQFNKVDDSLIHVDFLELVEDKKIINNEINYNRRTIEDRKRKKSHPPTSLSKTGARCNLRWSK